MAVVRPFIAIRPTPKLADKIASLPYDVMNTKEAKIYVKDNPYSFMRIDRAEVIFEQISPYDPKVYVKAKELLEKQIAEGIYIEESKPCLYLYRLIMNGRSQTGIACCTSVDDYLNNKIKKHEFTRADKEQDRINHVDALNANTGPIFLTYRNSKKINEITSKIIIQKPIYDFISEDGVSHTLWVIENINDINLICNEFANIENLYIADGHHRNASAVKVALKRREQYKDYSGDEEFNFYLSVLFPDNELYIMDYNRIVKDLNALSVDEFLNKVSEKFTVEKSDKEVKPNKKHTFGMYVNKQWYKLSPRAGTYDENNPVSKLDVSILQENLLSPILNIDDPRTNSRIDFVGGIRGLSELVKRVDSREMAVAFSLFATEIWDVMEIADSGNVMPPKSTWFEPKLRSGLLIHKL